MEKSFGKELDPRKIEWGIKLGEFKDLMLYLLEDYLFRTKFNDKVMRLNIPSLGISFNVKEQYALDLRGFFDIPQISFDERGCIYNNGKEGAYISPEFFAKCFLERAMEVLTSLTKLYLPKYLMEKEKNNQFEGNFDIEIPNESEESNQNSSKKEEFPHMDFVETYTGLVNLKKINQALSQGLVGILKEPTNNPNSIIFLRKLEFAAKFQTDIEFVFNQFIKEKYEEEIWDLDYTEFWESAAFKNLEKEHKQLFRNGPFVAPIEQPEYAMKNNSYDFGTDEERADWKKRYETLKHDFETKKVLKIREQYIYQNYSLIEIQKSLTDYWKIKICSYNYPRNIGDNPFINALGLDVTNYYAHPADKYLPNRRNKRIPDEYDEYFEEFTPDDYDSLYGSNYDDEFDDSYGYGIYR